MRAPRRTCRRGPRIGRVAPGNSDEVGALVAAHASALRGAYEEGKALHPRLAPAYDAFAAGWMRLVLRRLGNLGLEATPARVRAAIAGAAAPDLFLACACEQGIAPAWETLVAGLRPRLEGLARKQGKGRGDAEALVADVLGDLSLPPPRGGSRTLLGTYDGSGSLFGWLAVVLVRRVAAASRGRRVGSLDAAHEADAERGAPVAAASPPADPAEGALDAETTRRFERAVGEAWRTCTARERLALLLRHRDGLAQRQVAVVLGVGEPRASRLLAQGRRKLSAALNGSGGDPARERDWVLLREAVAHELTRFGAAVPPTVGRREIPGMDHAN